MTIFFEDFLDCRTWIVVRDFYREKDSVKQIIRLL